MLPSFLKDTETKDKLSDWLRQSLIKYSTDSLSNWADEDTLSGFFFGCLAGSVNTPSGLFSLKHYKTRGRGPAPEENKLGADGLLVVKINTAETVLEGYLLFQAKKTHSTSDTLVPCPISQCSTMLTHTAASYLLTLMPNMGFMTGAIAVSSHTLSTVRLSEIPYVNFPRFITEHLLHGLMLEPLSNLGQLRSKDLANVIKKVVIAIGSSEEKHETALREIEAAISEAGLTYSQ